MATSVLEVSLAQINAAATPSGAIAALEFDVTDVENNSGAQFKTDIDAATDAAAQNALRLLVGQPWQLFGGTTITVAGTAGYNGVHEIATNGVVASGGKLAFKTTTAFGSGEGTLTATAVFTKLAHFCFAMPALSATSMLVGYMVRGRGTVAAGVTNLQAQVVYIRPSGTVGGLASGTSLAGTAGAQVNVLSSGRVAGSAGDGPLDLTALWLLIHCNQEAGKQLDDITGLDGGVAAAVAYVSVPELAEA